MRDTSLLGPWIRRFLMEHMVSERNLARNTQRSYRDTLRLLLPAIARRARKSVDRLTVTDLSADRLRQFLNDLEEKRECAISTRNQRLAAIHALARFIGLHAPELVEWCGQIRTVPFKKAPQSLFLIWKSRKWMPCLRPRTRERLKAVGIMPCFSSCTTPAPGPTKRLRFVSAT